MSTPAPQLTSDQQDQVYTQRTLMALRVLMTRVPLFGLALIALGMSRKIHTLDFEQAQLVQFIVMPALLLVIIAVLINGAIGIYRAATMSEQEALDRAEGKVPDYNPISINNDTSGPFATGKVPRVGPFSRTSQPKSGPFS